MTATKTRSAFSGNGFPAATGRPLLHRRPDPAEQVGEPVDGEVGRVGGERSVPSPYVTPQVIAPAALPVRMSFFASPTITVSPPVAPASSMMRRSPWGSGFLVGKLSAPRTAKK